MTDKEKLKDIKKLADAMYYAAQYLTTDASRLHKAMDEYHKFIIHEWREEPVSIWHDGCEIPKSETNILMIRKEEKDTNYPPIAGCFHGTNSRLDGKNWGYYNGFCYNEIEAPYKWAYVDDFLALEEIPPKFPIISQKENPVCAFSTNRYTDEDRKVLCDGCEEECEYAQKEEPVSEDILDVSRIDYRLQHESIEDGIKYHAEEYSFNIESVLYNQLTGEQQKLWRKELERAVISGGYCGLELSRDKRYKENQEPVSEKKCTVKFVRTGGPFGDETCNYDVITNAETLEEFVTAILGKDNYQTICLRAGKGISSGDVCMAYATGGKITRKASNYDSLLTMRLKSVKVNGGWGNMTYDVWVEDELPAQERKEFQMVCWGYTFD